MKKDNNHIICFSGIEEITWFVKKTVVNELYKIFNLLPVEQSKIIKDNTVNSYNYILYSDDTTLMLCHDNTVLKRDSNVIEIKIDKNRLIENEILKTIPKQFSDQIFKFVNKTVFNRNKKKY